MLVYNKNNMPRRLMQDVLPKGQRSIRNIPLPESRVGSKVSPAPVRRESPVEPVDIDMPPRPPKPPVYDALDSSGDFSYNAGNTQGFGSWKKTITVSAIVLVVLLGFLASSIFHSAKVTVKVNSEEVPINNVSFTAKKVAGALEVRFEPLVIKRTGEAVAKSTGEKQIIERASGTIVVYNNHSGAEQRLIKNTRFETPSGLTYRIDSSITVPGKTNAGPGSIETLVYADEPGEKYNLTLSDFVIPGFKGDPRYETFYARSKTPMTGGFSGTMKVVSEDDRSFVDKDITARVTKELVSEVQTQVPEGYITYPGSYFIEWSELSQETVNSSEVRFKKEATLTAVMFKKADLAVYLAGKQLDDYKGEDLEIQNLVDLKVLPKNITSFNPSKDTSIEFAVSGKALFVWLFDEITLKEALADKSVGEMASVASQFSNVIENIDSDFSPFWRKSFPGNIEKIEVEIVL